MLSFREVLNKQKLNCGIKVRTEATCRKKEGKGNNAGKGQERISGVQTMLNFLTHV